MHMAEIAPERPPVTFAPCDPQEQNTIAKLGLELRLLTSDVDSEVERWEDQEHDIARQSQSISSMAFSMYLFTRYVWPRNTTALRQ